MELEKGIQLLQIERSKQLSKGYNLHNDLKYVSEALIDASICYLGYKNDSVDIDNIYPWPEETFKPSENVDSLQARKEDIIKAGAMIVAHLNVMQHLIDTRIELNQNLIYLKSRTVYFKLAGNFYYGLVLDQCVDQDGECVNIVQDIKSLISDKIFAEAISIELLNSEIWTFI